MKSSVLPIFLATIWISISEVFRNTFLLHGNWVEHYNNFGQTFPEQPINGVVWGVWSLVFAIVIFNLSKKFSFMETIILAWIIGFVMMWLVIGNLGVLPFTILPFAIPLSILEVSVAVWIIRKFNKI